MTISDDDLKKWRAEAAKKALALINSPADSLAYTRTVVLIDALMEERKASGARLILIREIIRKKVTP